MVAVVCVLALLVGFGPVIEQAQSSSSSGFRIVVVDGEDAVNVIQLKTATAPVVEIRDRNNLPVPGITVTFAIKGTATSFAGGTNTLSIVTNAAGRAAASGL